MPKTKYEDAKINFRGNPRTIPISVYKYIVNEISGKKERTNRTFGMPDEVLKFQSKRERLW